MVPVWSILLANAAPVESIEELDLEQLLDLEYDVASRMDLPTRETPGVVTVLPRQELVSAGARDLLDALSLLPSMMAAVDDWGVVGMAVRGQWAFDGKLLLLVDGVVMNEPLYGTTPLGHRIPVWAIEQIEIIRGPGSALYGGGAGLAVVKVTTVASRQEGTASAHLTTSLFDSGGVHQASASVSGRAPIGDDGQVGVLLTGGFGRRSDGTYVDIYGQTASMERGDFDLDPGLATATLRHDGLEVTALAEAYRTTFRDGYGTRTLVPHTSDFYTLAGRAKWSLPAGATVDVTPRLSAQHMAPWQNRNLDASSEHWYADEVGQRVTAGIDVDVEAGERIDVYAGAEGGVDVGRIGEMIDWDFATGDQVTYTRGAVLAQAIARWPIATVTLGSRADLHSAYGWALSPRVAVTRVFEGAHIKLLGSRAFRAPSIEHLRYDVDPEYTWTAEIEAGFRPVEHIYVTVGGWEVSLEDPLFYTFVPGQGERYANGARAGTRGVEGEVRWQQGGAHLTAGWASWMSTAAPEPIAVEAHPYVHAGLPNHKGVLRGGTLVGPVDIGGALTWFAERESSGHVEGAPARHDELPPALLVDLTVAVPDLGLDGLDLQLQGRDLLDAQPGFASPLDSGHAPLPSSGRTFGAALVLSR